VKDLSRRDFGKNLSAGVLGSLAAGSVGPLASAEGASSQSVPKRMTTVLRELMKAPGIIDYPSTYDPFTARIAELVGFRCVALGGNVLGAASCVPEPLLTMDEVLAAARRITDVIHIPLIVDVGAGFGDVIHVMRTVREFENARVAGIHIEDQVYPKQVSYHRGVEQIISAEDMCQKVRYAIQARRDPAFVIQARTDAFRTNGFAEGIRRANLYAEAGADAVVAYPNTLAEAQQVPKEIHCPVAYHNSEGNRFGRPIFSVREAEAMGFKFIKSVSIDKIAFKAVREFFSHLKETGRADMDPAVYAPIRDEIEKMIGLDELVRIEQKTTESKAKP
jgi:methylisocitrate lyase